MYDSTDHFDITQGEDGLPCKHTSVDWLGEAATCPECGSLLVPLEESASGAKLVPSLPSLEEPEPGDLPDVPFNPEKTN